MTPTAQDALSTAHDLTRQARDRAFAAARRDPGSTWIDAYRAIDRAEAQLTAAAGADVAAGPATGPQPSGRTCHALLLAAQDALAQIAAGDGPSLLPIARAYLRDAVDEVTGRES